MKIERWILSALILAALGASLLIQQGHIQFFGEDLDDARYLLSALFQGLAAILAVVVTITLVILQLAATSYTPRLISIYIWNSYFWFLLFLYIFTMSYCLILLNNVGQWLVSNHIEYVTLLTIVSLVYLVPYIISASKMLRPSTAIGKLALKLIKETNDLVTEMQLNRISKNEDSELGVEEISPKLQPLSDIIIGAINRFDSESAIQGIQGIINTYKYLLPILKSKRIDDEGFTTEYCNHLERYSKLAFEKDNDEISVGVLLSLGTMGSIAASNEFGKSVLRIESTIGKIGVVAIEQQSRWISEVAIDTLSEMYVIAKDHKFELTTLWLPIIYVQHIGIITSAIHEFNDITMKGISSLIIFSEEHEDLIKEGFEKIHELLKAEYLPAVKGFKKLYQKEMTKLKNSKKD